MIVFSDVNAQTLVLVGRILLALIFIVSGLSKIPGWETTLQYMTQKGIPLAPFFLFSAVFIEVAAGFSLLLGFKARVAAVVLSFYMIVVTLTMHNFWVYQGMERQSQLINFMKNLAILGGLFQVVSVGAGRMSLDYWDYRRKNQFKGEPRERLRAVS
jgi:putative oxidoreductase